MATFIRNRPLASFFLLACGLTWLISVPWMLSRRGFIAIHPSEAWEMLAAFGPFAAALIVTWAVAGKRGMHGIFKGLLRWRVGWFWISFTVLTPFLCLFVAAIFSTLQTGAWPELVNERTAALLTLAGLFDLLIVSGFIQGVGEEPGWRGLALPLLRTRFGPLTATLALFPIWLLWHVPSFLARPNFGLIQWVGFSVGILSAAVWLTLIWDRTRSILMAVLWHQLININRNIALAISMPMFLAIGNAVLLGALIIIVYWLVKKPGTDSRASIPLST